MGFTANLLRARIRLVATITISMLYMLVVGNALPGQSTVTQRAPLSLKAQTSKLREQAAALAEVAAKIRINGRSQDWQGIPILGGDTVNDCADRTRDLVGCAVAPFSDRILVLLDTRGKPTQDPNSFWVEFDIAGAHVVDFQIGLSPGKENLVWIYKQGQPVVQTTIEGVRYKIGSHVTAEIPLAAVRQSYEQVDEDFPDDALARGWVRIRTSTFNQVHLTDQGPTAASPVLDRDEFFDLPTTAIKDRSKWNRGITLPLDGEWFVGQGADGIWTHQDLHAYDLYQVDGSLEPASQPKAKTNSEYLCWDKPVRAPERSRVMRVEQNTVDNEPFDQTNQGPANEVYLDIGGNVGMHLMHFRQDAIAVEAGQVVEAEAVLGRIGNSGSYTFPHLHFSLWQLPLGKQTIPGAFQDVRVSLNPDSPCPWSRDFPIWVIEEGWFVERLPAPANKKTPDKAGS